MIPRTRKRIKDSNFIPNPTILRQSIIELRGVYIDMDEMEFCLFYERRYGVKRKDVKSYLRSAENE